MTAPVRIFRNGAFFPALLHGGSLSLKPHLGRSDSAPESSAVEELKRNLEEVSQFSGSKLEQLIMLFYKQTKFCYNKLTEEEKQWLAWIAQKSEFQDSPYQRCWAWFCPIPIPSIPLE